MLINTDEEFHQITIEEYFNTNVKPNLFAVSRVFAEARKQMNLAEYKAFTYALSNISWKDPCPDTLYLNKKELAQVIGIECDIDHLSQNLMRAIGDMPRNSFLKFSDKDNGLYLNGNFVRTIACFKNIVRIRLEEDYLSLFGNLEKDYITMWSADIYKMTSKRSIKFYELLRENSDTRLDRQEGVLGIKALKELFEIPEDGPGSYMRDSKNGGFDRNKFEQRIIEPLCRDLSKTEMIQLVLQENGKFYEKIKKDGKVIGYRFNWLLSTRPQVASALQLEAIKKGIEKNPEIEKIAKDLITGRRKTKPKKGLVKCSTERTYSKEEMAEIERNALR